MYRTLEVSKSGFYAWQKRLESKRSKERKILSKKIKTIFENSRRTYGIARVHACLREENEWCSRPRVAGIMRELGLKGKRKGIIRKKTTNSNHALEVAQNKLEREFKAEKPNQKWVADLTYIPTLEGWLFLAVVLDLFSRKIVGWSMSESLETQVVLDALEMARSSRNPRAGLLHHSDRGVQYGAGIHRLALEKFGAISSMSRRGNCWDNAVVESLLGTLKCELDLDKPIGSMAETRGMVFEWIEVWYNRERRHSSLGFLSPVVFEERHQTLF
jgi:putative transposase